MVNSEITYYCPKCGWHTFFTPTVKSTCCKVCNTQMLESPEEYNLTITQAVKHKEEFNNNYERLLNNLVKSSPDFNLDLHRDKDRIIADQKAEHDRQYQVVQNFKASQESAPKCLACGSTNVKKISGGRRWLTTGLFGLASSDVGKTMECKSCGYKF